MTALVLGAGFAWPGKTSATVPGVNELISVDSNENQANQVSTYNDISADGRYVVFASSASNLVSGDTNGADDIFVRDRTNGTTVIVSTSTGGTIGNDGSFDPEISYNGRYVVFASAASNLVSADTNNTPDVFIHDMQTGTTNLVSSNASGVIGNSASEWPDVSADGRYVVFDSVSTNLVSGMSGQQIYIKDLSTGAVRVLSVSSSGVAGNGASVAPKISCDAGTVAFSSQASNLVSGDTNGYEDVFVDNLGWSGDQMVNASQDGNNASYHPQISCDGNYVVYDANGSNLVSNDSNSTKDVLRYSRVKQTNELVSVATNGTQGNDISQYAAISGDGRYVAFMSNATTFDSRVPATSNSNIFIRDMKASTTQLITADLGNEGIGAAQIPSVSADGSYVTYESNAENTASNATRGLVASDANHYSDVFGSETGF